VQRLGNQHIKILKQLVRVSIRDSLDDYAITKSLKEIAIVKETEKIQYAMGK
jgi:hypothetical protein